MILSNEIDCWWYLDEDGINKLYNFVCSEYGKLSFKKISHLIKKITSRNNEASLINERFVPSNEAISNLEHVVSYLFQKKFIVLKDSIFNENIHKQISELQTKYETEKIEKELQVKNLQIEKNNSEIKTQKIIIYSLLLFFLLQ